MCRALEMINSPLKDLLKFVLNINMLVQQKLRFYNTKNCRAFGKKLP